MKRKLPASEVAALLGKIAALDNRNTSMESAIEFAAALDPMTLEDAKAAVVEHRNKTAEWLMPAHINDIVRTMRRHRIEGVPTAEPPAELDGHPAKTIAWTKARIAGIGDGLTIEEAEHQADQQLGINRAQLPARPNPARIAAIRQQAAKRIPN